MNVWTCPSKSPSPSSSASDSAGIWLEFWVMTHLFQLFYVPYTKKDYNCFFCLPYMRRPVDNISDVLLSLHHNTKPVLKEDWITLQQITAAIKLKRSFIYALWIFILLFFLKQSSEKNFCVIKWKRKSISELKFSIYFFCKAWVNGHNCFLFYQLLDQSMRCEIINKCSFTLFYFITSCVSKLLCQL